MQKYASVRAQSGYRPMSHNSVILLKKTTKLFISDAQWVEVVVTHPNNEK